MPYLRPTSSSGPELLAGLNLDGTPVSWLEANWPFLSWAAFLFGAGILVSRWPQRHTAAWDGWLAFVMYCLHQSEEHAYDIRGWRYAFIPSLNTGPIRELFRDICADSELACPMDPKMTLYINGIAIWVGFGGCMVVAMVYPHRFLASGYLNWGMAIINGVFGHIVTAILTRSYNPGVVQSLFMVPLGLFLLLQQSKNAAHRHRPVLGICLAFGVAAHLVLVGSVKLAYRFRNHVHNNMSVIMAGPLVFASLVLPLILSNVLSQRANVQSRSSSDKSN